jgi:hypothetical protein
VQVKLAVTGGTVTGIAFTLSRGMLEREISQTSPDAVQVALIP